MGLEPQSSLSEAWIAVLSKVDSQVRGRALVNGEKTAQSSRVALEGKEDQDFAVRST